MVDETNIQDLTICNLENDYLSEEHHVETNADSTSVLNSSDNVKMVQWNFDTIEEVVKCDESSSTKVSSETEELKMKENEISVTKLHKNQKSTSTQTDTVPRYDIEDFKDQPKYVLHFTGLENYKKFMIVLHSLGPAIYYLKYARSSVGNISVPNQFFFGVMEVKKISK